MNSRPEISRPIRADRVGTAPQTHDITAHPEECIALAARLGIPAVGQLTAQFIVRRDRADRLTGQLSLKARLTRVCVVTLEEFETAMSEQAELVFIEAAGPVSDEDEDFGGELNDPDQPDPIPYINGVIDLGETLAEQMALALDPYPRKPGARLAAEQDEATLHPFARLAALRKPS
ncbi:MAG: hypothetical protein B7Z78_10990 [Rhodospirillales bacterium 20-60-12]|nr:MAG: hypothetical protein B7Z78_10990 [Rhodospirillales bacterium 20-60-12]